MPITFHLQNNGTTQELSTLHTSIENPHIRIMLSSFYSFIHLFIFRRSFTRYGNSHINNNTIKAAAYCIYMKNCISIRK